MTAGFESAPASRCIQHDRFRGPRIQSRRLSFSECVVLAGVTSQMRQSESIDMAFNLERGAELRERWYLIPTHVDVLISYGPPQFVLDRTGPYWRS